MLNTIISIVTIAIGAWIIFGGKISEWLPKLIAWWKNKSPAVVVPSDSKLTNVDGVKAIDTLVALGTQNGNTALVDAAFACGKALYTPKG